jgi:delta-aminolevulinic acid dehydratase/porphobilinogen synthase
MNATNAVIQGLTSMAAYTERAADGALKVAANITKDSSTESLQKIALYAAGASAVIFGLRAFNK